MKNLLVITAVTLVSGISGLLMSKQKDQRNTDRSNVVNTTKEYQRDRIDSLRAEIHNDSLLYCKARVREDSIRRNTQFAFVR